MTAMCASRRDAQCADDNGFRFQRAEEAFNGRIVPAVAGAAHTHPDAAGVQQRPVAMTRILTAAIGVMELGLGPRRQRDVQRGSHERRAQSVLERPADDPPRAEVEDDGQIAPAGARPQGGDISRPDAMGCGDGKPTSEVIGGHRPAMRAVGRDPKTAPALSREPRRAHQAGHSASR